jgi:hypothetical protein
MVRAGLDGGDHEQEQSRHAHPDIVRELRDDELERVNGGKNGAIVVADFNWSVRRSDGGRS